MAGHPPHAEPDAAIRAFVMASGLVSGAAAPRFSPLTGGVSSDIWLVETDERAFCVKRALAKLKVAGDWQAPIDRNLYEAQYLRDAARLVPGTAPEILAQDRDKGMFAMAYLGGGAMPLWKAELLAGRVDPGFAALVGEKLAALHSAFARDPGAAQRFSPDGNFHALRLEPYLLATAKAHADLEAPLKALAARTQTTKRSVVHGDISPKNILIGAQGPVFLDAECAWFGDPGFDLAFCLNHLLLKCLPVPDKAAALSESFARLTDNYLAGIDWEDPAGLEVRAAALLPALLLARIDGKSPVEYITQSEDARFVRDIARPLIAAPPARLATISEVWARAIGEKQK